MNYSEIAFKIINHVIRLQPYQSVTISAEIHNVYDFNEPLCELPFLEELALVVRKHKGLPILDISSENIHKRFFEEIIEENQDIATELLNKWLSMSDLFIDLSWRSNPNFYKSIPERTFKRFTLAPKNFIELFREKNKKLILLGFPTQGLAQHFGIDHEALKKGYFSSLNIDYFALKNRCYIFDGKMKEKKNWDIITERRTLKVELIKTSKLFFGDFLDELMITLPTGYWQQRVNIDTMNGIFFCDNIFYEQYIWHNIQIVFDNGRVVDVETDIQQSNMNLLKSILYYDQESIILNIGLNDSNNTKTLYSLFDMIKDRNLSLIMNSSKGQLIALSETAGLESIDQVDS